MTREMLSHLATEAKRFEKLTYHLKVNGKPIESLQLELENEKHHDPLRQRLMDNQSTSCG